MSMPNDNKTLVRAVEVVDHPDGGFTVAVPVGPGTVREYRGQFETETAAWSAAQAAGLVPAAAA